MIRTIALALSCAVAAVLPSDPIQAEERVIEEIVVTARFREESLQDVPLAINAFSSEELEREQIKTTFDLQYQTPGMFATRDVSGPTGASLAIRGQSASDSLLTTDSSVGVYVDGVSIPRFFGLNTSLFDVERVEILKGPQGTLFGRNTTGGAIQFVTQKADYDALEGYLEAEAGRFDTMNVGGAINLPLSDWAAVRLSGKHFGSDGWGTSSEDGQKINDNDEQIVRGSFVADPTDQLNVVLTSEYQRVDNEAAPYISITHGTGLVGMNAQLEGYADPDEYSLAGGADIDDFSTAFPGGTTQPRVVSFDEYERRAVSAALTLDLASVTLKSITGWHDFESGRSLDLDGGPSSGFQATLFTEADFFSQEFQVLGTAIEERLEWVVGAYYSSEDGTDLSESFLADALGAVLSPVGIPVPVFEGDVQNDSWAAFAQGNYQLTEKLRVTLGYRYTEEDKSLVSFNRQTIGGIDGTVIDCSVPGGVIGDCRYKVNDSFDGDAWLVSLDYHVTDDVMVYLRSAESFKGGGQNLRGTPVVLTFAPIESETARDIELGFKGQLADGRVEVNAAAYRTKYEDIQRSRNEEIDGQFLTLIKNAAEATLQGIELSGTWLATERLSLELHANYFDGEYDDWPDQLLTSTGEVIPVDRSITPFPDPEYTYTASASWDQPVSFGYVSATVDYIWQDDALLFPDRVYALPPTDPEWQDPSLVTQESFSLVNARMVVEVTDMGLEVAFFGRNLTGEEYLTGVGDNSRTALGSIVGLAGEPRTWGLSVKKYW